MQFCKTCFTCQVVGNPNLVVPPAPLFPITAFGEPFEDVIVDCVGPLPWTKYGHQFLLTILCVSTRFLEAIQYRKSLHQLLLKLKFFTTFGLRKTMQTTREPISALRTLNRLCSLSVCLIQCQAWMRVCPLLSLCPFESLGSFGPFGPLVTMCVAH